MSLSPFPRLLVRCLALALMLPTISVGAREMAAQCRTECHGRALLVTNGAGSRPVVWRTPVRVFVPHHANAIGFAIQLETKAAMMGIPLKRVDHPDQANIRVIVADKDSAALDHWQWNGYSGTCRVSLRVIGDSILGAEVRLAGAGDWAAGCDAPWQALGVHRPKGLPDRNHDPVSPTSGSMDALVAYLRALNEMIEKTSPR